MFLAKVLDKVGENEKLILYCGISIAIATAPICASIAVVHLKDLSYSDGNRQINLKGKSQQVNQDIEKKTDNLRKQIKDTNQDTSELLEAVIDVLLWLKPRGFQI